MVNEEVKSLDDNEPTRELTVKCQLDKSSIILTEEVWKKNRVLATVFENDSTVTEITIGIKECTQETLKLVNDFMNGKIIWKHITSSNVKNLAVLANYLCLNGITERLDLVHGWKVSDGLKIKASNIEDLITLAYNLNLQLLYDQCIVWIMEQMRCNEFQLSEQFKQDYPEVNKEIVALSSMRLESFDTYYSHVSTIIKINDLFEKFKDIQRFSGLNLLISGDFDQPAYKKYFEKIKSNCGFKAQLTENENFNKNIRVNSLSIHSHEHFKLVFSNSDLSFPVLKRLSLYGISDLKLLSMLFNDDAFWDKMPQLEELDLSNNSNLKLNTFQLTRKVVQLKRLKLVNCGLKKISHLANILNHLPQLEELDLRLNDKIQLNTLKLNKDIQLKLKLLNLGRCELTDIAPLAKLLNAHLPSLEILDLSYNPNIQLTNFDLETPHLSLKRLDLLKCGLTDISPLAKLLNDNKIPNLEKLNLGFNDNIQLNSLNNETLDSLRGKLLV